MLDAIVDVVRHGFVLIVTLFILTFLCVLLHFPHLVVCFGTHGKTWALQSWALWPVLFIAISLWYGRTQVSSEVECREQMLTTWPVKLNVKLLGRPQVHIAVYSIYLAWPCKYHCYTSVLFSPKKSFKCQCTSCIVTTQLCT